MKTILEVGQDKLTWALKSDRHELRAGKDLVASLQLQKGHHYLRGKLRRANGPSSGRAGSARKLPCGGRMKRPI
jgi:hypothetical protein